MADIQVDMDEEAVISLFGDESAELAVFMNDAAEQIVELAQSHAPVDTGYLRDHIHVIDGDTPGSKFVASDADYTLDVEFGTRNMPAQPFMRPAMDGVSL